MNKKTILTLLTILLTTTTAAQTGNYTQGDNYTDTFTATPQQVDTNISVDTFGQKIQDIELLYEDNQTKATRTFETSTTGNLSNITDIPSQLTLFYNQTSSFPVIANVPANQEFGSYKGNITITDTSNKNFTTNITVDVNVIDDVPPTFESNDVRNVQATNNVSWSFTVDDNLKPDNLSAEIFREVNVTEGNNSFVQNQSFKNISFNQQENPSKFNYLFSDTDTIGQYHLEANLTDESGNTVSKTIPFKVTGLDSITVLNNNPVFDTIRATEETSEELVSSTNKGKPFTVRLDSLDYEGNETIRFGVVRPSGGSVEIIDVNDSKTFTEEGDYRFKVMHSGNDELEGTHDYFGEITVVRPEQHVGGNASISFSGTVKNIDKPPATTTLVNSWQASVAYSFEEAVKLYEEEFGGLEDDGSQSLIYSVQTIPISECEGYQEFNECTEPAFGEVNESVSELKREKQEAVNKMNDAQNKMKISWAFVLFFTGFTFYNRYGGGVYEVEKRIEKDKIGQQVSSVDDLEV